MLPDAILLLFLGTMAAIVVVPIVRARGRISHYAPKGALVDGEALVGEPLELALPAGPALEVMLRYTVDHGEPTWNPEPSRLRNGLAVLDEVERPPHSARHEVVMGNAEPLGRAPVRPGEPTYDVGRFGGQESGTKVLARVPAGGEGRVRILVDHVTTRDYGLTVFAKPAPTA